MNGGLMERITRITIAFLALMISVLLVGSVTAAVIDDEFEGFQFIKMET